jgi:HAD superfamily hydrolase (TIGR01509 family)
MIRAITFDLDGVYFINGKTNFVKNLAILGVSEKDVSEVFFKSDKMNCEYKSGMISDKEYWSWALEEWGLNISVEAIIELLIDGYETNEQVVDVVKNVRRRGYKTLVCTNNFPARINGLEQKFGFLDKFDATAISYEIGETKPSVEIFEELINRSGVEASEIVFADDDESKLSGARALGIQTFIYTGFDSFLDSLRSLGVETAVKPA